MASESEDNRPPEDEDEEGGPIKTFLEHLEDLRWVFIKCGSALLLGLVICLAAAPQLFNFLQWPLLNVNAGLPPENQIRIMFLGPLGGVMSSMKIALYGGICLALPFILYFIGEFVMPALKRHEKKFFLRAFLVGGGLFMLGLMICYFWVLEISLRGMASYNKWLNLPADVWRAEEYFQFITVFMLAMGICFELPILVLGLVKVGLVDYQALSKSRPYLFIGIFGTIAFITPDFISTFFLVIPVFLLFEICIWIAWYWERQRRAAEKVLAAAGTKETQ
jgi:sec-independent protein translocase protein TatC